MTFNARVLLVIVACALSGHMAFAQAVQSSGTSGGLFGPGRARESRQGLDFSISLAELYDSDTPAEFRVVDPMSLGGYSTMLEGTAEYRYNGTRLQFASSGMSVFRYYDALREVRSLSHSAGLGLSARLGGRTSFAINQTAAYSPSYLFGLFPRAAGELGDAIPAAPDYAVSQTQSYTYGTYVTLRRLVTRRSQLTFSGQAGYTDFLHEDDLRRDLKSFGGRGEFSRNLTRNVALAAGYRFRSGDFGYGSSTTTTEHGVDVGMSFSRPLSASRRALFDVRVGALTAVLPAGLEPSVAESRRYQLLAAEATVGYQFSRSWLAQGTYRRGFEFVAGLTEPVTIDGVSAGLTGLLSRRLDLSLSGGYSSGNSIIHPTGMNFDTYRGSWRLRYALSATAAVYAEYLYFFYDFGASPELAPGIASGLERNGVRVGLTWRMSVLGR